MNTSRRRLLTAAAFLLGAATLTPALAAVLDNTTFAQIREHQNDLKEGRTQLLDYVI